MQLHITTHVGSGGGDVQVCNFISQLMWVVVVQVCNFHILTHVGSGGRGVQVCNFTSQLMWVVVVGMYKCATSYLNSCG